MYSREAWRLDEQEICIQPIEQVMLTFDANIGLTILRHFPSCIRSVKISITMAASIAQTCVPV